MVRMESKMSSTLGVRSVVASAFCVLDRYTSERFGRLRSTRGEGASGVSPDVDGLGVLGTERSAGVDGAVEGQNARAVCPCVGCGMPAGE
jgi:hypothetical protein